MVSKHRGGGSRELSCRRRQRRGSRLDHWHERLSHRRSFNVPRLGCPLFPDLSRRLELFREKDLFHYAPHYKRLKGGRCGIAAARYVLGFVRFGAVQTKLRPIYPLFFYCNGNLEQSRALRRAPNAPAAVVTGSPILFQSQACPSPLSVFVVSHTLAVASAPIANRSVPASGQVNAQNTGERSLTKLQVARGSWASLPSRCALGYLCNTRVYGVLVVFRLSSMALVPHRAIHLRRSK